MNKTLIAAALLLTTVITHADPWYKTQRRAQHEYLRVAEDIV